MPGGDQTGPLGRGSRTGRAMGYCAGYSAPGYINPARGRGFWGRGRGFGRGFGRKLCWNDLYPPYTPRHVPESTNRPDPKDEKKYLEEVVAELEDELTNVKKRLEEVSKEPKNE